MVNDYAATAFIGTVQRAGLRVPGDVSVVSHADMPIARHSATPLTTMTHPIEVIAQQVTELLASRADGRYSGPAREVVVRGEWPGTIAREPRGDGGFGYDPVFVPAGSDCTVAQLSPQDKDAASHRGRALALLLPALRELA